MSSSSNASDVELSRSYIDTSSHSDGEQDKWKNESSASTSTTYSYAESTEADSDSLDLLKSNQGYWTETRNLSLILCVPMAFVAILNAVPLSDPFQQYDSLWELTLDQWGFLFVYHPWCFTLSSTQFTYMISYICKVEFTNFEYVQNWALFFVVSTTAYLTYAYLWMYPVPVGGLLGTIPGFSAYCILILYVVPRKMKARGLGHLVIPKVPAALAVLGVVFSEFLASLGAYNLMIHFNDNSGIQIAVTIGYTVVTSTQLTIIETILTKYVGPKATSLCDFLHYCHTIWYKSFVMAEISGVSVLIVTIAIDYLMISKDVFSFAVAYDRVVDRIKAVFKGKGAAGSSAVSMSSVESASSEYSEEGVALQGAMSRADMIDLFETLDTDNSGSLDRAELAILGSKIGVAVDELVIYDKDGSGQLSRDEFLEFMLDRVSDFKIDKYAARQWASVTAPLYYMVVLTSVTFGPNTDYFLTSLHCEGGMSAAECEDHKWTAYSRAGYYSLAMLVARLLSNGVAAYILRTSYGIDIIRAGLAKIASNLRFHIWEACFGTLVMVKFILLHSNSDLFKLNLTVSPWSPFNPDNQ